MPQIKLDVTDAAELAELLQFLSQWLARDPARLAASLAISSATPPITSPSCTRTWSGSSFCWAAATVSLCSARHPDGQPHVRPDRAARPRSGRGPHRTCPAG